MDNSNFARAACTVLVVEDSSTQAEHLRFLLQEKGYTVSVAENGVRALKMLRENRPDLVISDVVMPEMDGFELCRKIKDDPELQDLPVVLLTSLVNPGDIIKGLEAGATNFITKPFDRDYLYTCLNAIMMNRALEAHEGVRLGLEVYFSGSRHTITAERKQILALLLSTFETAVHKNAELLKIEAELRDLNEQLEEKVRLRTEKLTAEVTERTRLEEQHAALARKLELVLNSAAEGIFGMTADYHCVFANATAAELLDYPQQYLSKLNMKQIWQHPKNGLSPEDDSSIFGLENHGDHPRKGKAFFSKRDGTIFPVRYTASRLDESEAGTMVVVTFMDITEELLAEKKIVTQLGRLDALHQIDILITASLDLRLTLAALLKMCLRELKADAAAIYLLKPGEIELERYLVAGFRSAKIDDRHLVASPELFSNRSSNTSTSSDIFAPINLPSFTEEGFVDYYRIPLFIKGNPCGVLELFNRSPLMRDDAWTEYAHTLARHGMIAIDNHQLLTRLERSNANLTEAYEATIEGWSRALDLRDHETEGHTQRVAIMTIYLARRMGYHDEQLVHIRRGALLHDIGKMGVPDSILLKPGPLSDDEWKIMKMHPTYAYDLLNPISYLRPALDIPYCHHEKWDGTGYPRGLRGNDIPKAARVFAVADIWDALQSTRPYREAWPSEKIREHIRLLSGTHLEPSVVRAFLEVDLQKIGALIDITPEINVRHRKILR